jgi:hydroxymethylbilane synthase
VARTDGTEQLKHRASVALTYTAADDDAARALGVRVAVALLADGADQLAPLTAAPPRPQPAPADPTPSGAPGQDSRDDVPTPQGSTEP